MRWLLPVLVGPVMVACSDVPPPAAAAAASPAAGCLAGGEGRLEAALRGALEADLDWGNAEMECDGDLRPDGSGLRVTVAGPLPPAATGAAPGQRLRFIFGIDLDDIATGPAQALPTNLTLILEGGNQLYATRGGELCAVENLDRAASGAGVERVSVRGYCLGPASDLAGEKRVLVPTFSFTALLRTAEEAGDVVRNSP